MCYKSLPADNIVPIIAVAASEWPWPASWLQSDSTNKNSACGAWVEQTVETVCES